MACEQVFRGTFLNGLTTVFFLLVTWTLQGCSGQTWQPQSDVLFVLDSTDTVGAANFDTMKQFMKDLVQQLNIGSNGIQVGAITYGNGIHNEFNLKDVSNVQDALNKIDGISFKGGSSDSSDAYKYAHEIGFTGVNGARPGVPHIIIHVTDEPTNDLAATVQEANRAFDKGMVIYNVGVGEGTGKDKLSEVTSDPLSRYLVHADTFSSLKSLVPTLSSRIKNEVPVSTQQLPTPSSCLQKADVVFLVDSSDSVGQNDFQHLEDFLKDAIVQLPIGPNGVRVGLMQFANYPSLEFGLDTYTEKMSLLRATDSLTFMGGSSNTADAINYATDEVFSSKVGARYGVPHIAVVITDGQSTDDISTSIAADRARARGISLISVGVGQNIDLNDLKDIANDPDVDHVFQSPTYKNLKGLSKQILDAACNFTAIATAPPTLPPGVTTADPCYDVKDNCAYYSTDTCTSYESWARTNCNKYCGFCQTQTPVVDCKDDEKCSDYGSYVCTDTNYVGWARQHCQQYCGFCPKDTKASGFYGKCFYKGREYSHAEKWQDGCDYECVCEDGETGTYRCYNKCPVYKNLPTECTLIAVPNECCLKPVCDYKPQITTTQGSGKGYNPQGIEMCEYGGKQYYDGQTWEVGCDLRCTCTDAKLGTHVCQSYCPTYQTVPGNCKLTKKPGDCCVTPVCEFETVTGIVTGDGSISGNGIGAPTPDRTCIDKLPDCRAYGKAACSQYPQWASDKCSLFCNVCVVKTPTPRADDACWYDGKQYAQNATWAVGCDKECTCEVASYGYYRCINKCPDYSDVPNGCTRQKRVGECCPVIECTNNKFLPSSTNVNSLGNGGGLKEIDPNGNTIPVMPTASSNTSVGPIRGPQLNGCLFNGKVYIQSQQWEVGCNLTCICVNANTGVYECRERCPKYENVPKTCSNEPDPRDPCCTYPTNCATPYIPMPVYPKGVTNVGAVMTPNITDLVYGHYTTQFSVTFAGIPITKPTTPAFGLDGYCLYKGSRYLQGQQWTDGCDFYCVCEDGITGEYRCVEQCQHYVNLPPQYCHLETDPSNPCCMRPVCNFTAGYDVLNGRRNETLPPTTTTTPAPTTTLAPPKQRTTTQAPVRRALCNYKGYFYTEGQTWFDGCDFKCSCDDADENLYTCSDRCPTYVGDTTNCTQEVDPSDPQCCTIPVCQGRGIPPKQITGRNPKPNANKCVYKGVEYSGGDVWEDGCQYQCECTDPAIGLYTCTDKCPSYPNLPSNCKLVQDFTDPCCKVPQCVPTPAPIPGLNTSSCDYFGVKYLEGQAWTDGCDFNCRCEDANAGVYTCTQRCPTYDKLPFDCRLVTDTNDPCCEIPQCTNSPADPNQVPTLPPGTKEGNALIPNPGAVPIPGQKPSPGLIPLRSTCVYDGQVYNQDDEWYDGCDYWCQCVNATIGGYKCIERCPKYPPLPKQCQMVKDAANPCCDIAVCDPNFSTAAPNTLVPVKQTTLVPRKGEFCTYSGQFYAEGQTWYDGCSYKCVCEDGVTGAYRCTDRCPTQSPLPVGCSLIADPRDPVCCEIPSCSYTTLVPGQKGTLVPSLAPAVVTGRQVTPSPLPGNSPRKDACLYNGVIYREGVKWTDGCDYTCECVDGSTGQYRCTEICPQYASLPPQCVYVQDANNPCCQVPFCDPNFPTPSTLAPRNTIAPGIKTDACVYNGVPYKQGERWEDGCDLACVCEDAKVGSYRCDKRCPNFDQIPSGCVLSASTKDACCQELTCQPGAIPTTSPTPYPLPYPIPVMVPGTRTGQTVDPSGNNPKGCLYNGQIHRLGDSWNDRCDLKCTCLDEENAIYQCTDRCVEYKSLPSACQLVPNPNDACCEVPMCSNGTDPQASTLVPPMPGRTTLVPGVRDMCVYNGAYYSEGQQWYDGCDKVCVCLNATTNQQSCSSRCVDYSQVAIPTECQMVADPADPNCCQVPQCVPTPGPNGYPTPTPTSPGDPKPTPTVYVNIPGVVTGLAPLPTPTPDPNGGPTPPLRSACVYKGQEYRQGMKWQDGCDYNCVCVNETTGYYKCDQRCPTYPLVPQQCELTPDPNDYCCKVVSCDFNKPTPNPFIAPATMTRDPNAPTPTPIPGGVPIATPPTIRPDLAFCVYNGAPYSQGSTWTIGCDTKCRCEDATTNFYTCADRCPTYMSVPAGCSKVVDPSDACCSVVQCVPDPNATPAPGVNTATPTPVPTLVPGVITGKPGPGMTGRRAGCFHTGQVYRQGDKWEDGCAYNCECLDDQTGLYKCIERCPKFANIPNSCTLVPDQADLCCEALSCPTPTPSPLAPNMSTTPTVVPQKTDFCVYDGNMYTQGQVWFDGCDQTCVCENAKIQYHRCTQRCPQYSNIPPTCVLVNDPNDPTCCFVPQCDPNTGVKVTGFTGIVTGSGTPPLLPMSTLSPTMNNSCYYKGVSYTEGQKWRDACDYTCECVDGSTGGYTCTEICPRYTNPNVCPMVRDPNNACCTKPDCTTPPTTSPGPSPAIPPTPMPTPYPVSGGTTLSPQKAFCVYNGQPYDQFDTWNDACDLTCRCEDAGVGRVNCDQRCPVYNTVPTGCVMVTDPYDPCCQIPNCVPLPGQPLNPNATGVVGSITGSRLPVPNPRGPAPDTCIYHGVSYKEGQTWDDGCQYQCECVDGVEGKYVCFERCQRYPQIPSDCALLQDPSDQCCQNLYCGIPTKPSTTAWTGTPTIGGTPTPLPSLSPTPASPPSPGTGPTPPTPPQVTSITMRPPTVDTCVYNGQRYIQDQTWYDACDTVCTCDNATANFYTCQERCTRYNGVPTSCTSVPDPNDPTCCLVPDCPIPTPLPGAVPTPGPLPSILPPGMVTGIGKVPDPTPYPTPAFYTGTTPVPPTPQPGCLYKGTIYRQGENWDDGCEWRCVCDDETTGQYECTQRCPNIDPLGLPSQCSVVQDPNDACCQTTYCDFGGTPTPPTSNPTTANVTATTTAKGDFCVYNGAFYNQQETWLDGCQFKCTCDDSKNGYYTCNDRCPSYPALPPTCTLVTDPNDSCCSVPNCPPSPANATTLVPPTGTYVLNPNPQKTFFGQGGTPSVQPGGSNPKTGVNNACLYKGDFYTQDQTFMDGCDYSCECIDAQRGRYQCTERCSTYAAIPPDCTLEVDPHDSCCQIPICTPATPATTTPIPTPPTPSRSTATIAPPTISGKTTNLPPTKITKPPNMCLYGNNVYKRGDFWEVPGRCQYACICDDPANNVYTCHNACPMYTELPAYCSLVDDPSSSCCKKPYCEVNGKNVTSLVPFGTTDVFGSSSPPTNKPGPDGKRNCVYKGQTKTPGETWVEGCDYSCECLGEDGMYSCATRCPSYSSAVQVANCSSTSYPGQCCPSLQCNIPNVGPYKPTPQVPALPAIIPGPVAVQPTARPQGPTQSPQILIPPTGATPLPGGGYPLPPGTTFSEIRDRCVYDDKLYAEGESWDPDCNLHCQCMDGKTGYYKCDARCVNYSNTQLPANCSLVTDPGQCCARASCRRPDGTTIDPVKNPEPAFPVVGSPGKTITGSRPVFTVGTTTGSRSGCYYKSVRHSEGETWDDGCDLSCTCENGALGLYKCTERCPKWPLNLPSGCEMIPNQNQCCDDISCTSGPLPQTSPPPPPTTTTTPTPTTASTTTPTTTTTTTTTTASTTPGTTRDPMFDPNCHDNLANCKSYGKSSCQDPYVGWARKNCNMTCGFCTPSFTTTSAPCVDAIQCDAYDKSVCTTYSQWALKNCRSFCGLCGTTVAPAATTPSDQCADKLNCAAYGDYICITDTYKAWAQTNCPAFCGLCVASSGPTTAMTTPPTTPAGWSLLLKGVAGVPGDLASLWKSNSPLNENNPKAQTLTPDFRGHYKSSKVDQWDQCKFNEVMVSVFKNGVEEGNIVFDVRGLDKNSWFRPDRIISSTWSDIRSNAAAFSLDKAAPTAREFMATDSSSCTGNAWLFVSTSDVCQFEQSGAAPRFLYSQTGSAAQLGQDQLGEGDVFAVFGHGGNCDGNAAPGTSGQARTTVPSNVCVYNGTVYKQDDTWKDGCAIDCTCVEAAKGRYVCNDICPKYPNLTSTCTLVKKPGKCCQEPICNGFEPVKSCYYKGDSYSEGALWTDGCDFDCQCVNATTGDFRCKSVCPRWNLPSQCTLGDPAPGLCCKTPQCPFTWTPPAGYVPR